MRTRQSNTAEQLGHSSDFLNLSPLRGSAPASHEDGLLAPARAASPPFVHTESGPLTRRQPRSSALAWAEEDEGLLHDASNLISAVGLYCDLLAMPGVLREEHRHYAEELRLLGSRSVAMVEQLIERRVDARQQDAVAPPPGPPDRRRGPDGSTYALPRDPPGALRGMVERCAGLLQRVAGDHAIQIAYGEAAALPVRVPAESVERILVNLVRNAAAAMEGLSGGPIRIGVGVPPASARPWPFQHVCLTVEDSGCGMNSAALERLLGSGAGPARSRHGIGFRVVRELVRSSRGELFVTSRPGEGTRVEIECPVAPLTEESAAQSRGARRTTWQS